MRPPKRKGGDVVREDFRNQDGRQGGVDVPCDDGGRGLPDAGIVFARRPYSLVILVRGVQEQKESAAVMAAISRAVYANLNP